MAEDLDTLTLRLARFHNCMNVGTDTTDTERLPAAISTWALCEAQRRMCLPGMWFVQAKTSFSAATGQDGDYSIRTEVGITNLIGFKRIFRLDDDGNVAELTALTHEDLITEYPPGTAAGTPAAYAVLGDTLEVRPEPSATLTLYVEHEARVADLSASAKTNILTQEAHEELFWVAMEVLCDYIPGAEDRRAIWTDRAEDAIADLLLRSGRRTDDDPIQKGTPGIHRERHTVTESK